jgi:DeoR/GlpR family transcriptional regulator of sugar metabolism
MFVQERASNGQLLTAERRQAILDALARDGKVVAARLVQELGVSEDTVRRDLRELAAQGLVQRVHGGALPPAPQPGSFEHRRETCSAEKAALAEAAVGLLEDARVVLLDGSTTNLELARRLPADRPCTVLTNSPPIAAALAEHPVADVVMIGGSLDKRAQVTTGAAAVDFIRSVRADACVLGVCALHPEVGLSTDDLEEAHVKRAMVEAAADVIALATADKLRAGSPYLVAPVAALTHLVAETAASDELLDPYRAAGVSVTRA